MYLSSQRLQDGFVQSRTPRGFLLLGASHCIAPHVAEGLALLELELLLVLVLVLMVSGGPRTGVLVLLELIVSGGPRTGVLTVLELELVLVLVVSGGPVVGVLGLAVGGFEVVLVEVRI